MSSDTVMSDTDLILLQSGYVIQRTPAGRAVFVNPNFYPLSDEQLALEDDYAEDWDQMDADEEEWYDDERDWGMEWYDTSCELEG
jgi:hypothetical protein